MNINRRKLLSTGGAMVGAGLFGKFLVRAAHGASLSNAEVMADPVLKAVASFVGQYSKGATFRMHQARGQRHCTIKAPISDLNRFVESFNNEQGLPFEPILCNGSQMTFVHRGTFFALNHSNSVLYHNP